MSRRENPNPPGGTMGDLQSWALEDLCELTQKRNEGENWTAKQVA